MEIISYMMSDKSLLFEEDYSRGPADGVKQAGDFILHSDIIDKVREFVKEQWEGWVF